MAYRQCTAKSKRTGERCKARAVNGMEVCYMHGGATPRGAALPQFKHGLYSKALPTRMQAVYEAALRDPELLTLQRSIAVMDSRIVDLLTRVETGESGVIWSALRKSWDDLHSADKKKAADALNEIGALIQRGASDYAAWNEIGRLLDDRRKHVETQQRLETAGERGVSMTELATFVGALMSIIQATVSNPKEKQQIGIDLERLLTERRPPLQ